MWSLPCFLPVTGSFGPAWRITKSKTCNAASSSFSSRQHVAILRWSLVCQIKMSGLDDRWEIARYRNLSEPPGRWFIPCMYVNFSSLRSHLILGRSLRDKKSNQDSTQCISWERQSYLWKAYIRHMGAQMSHCRNLQTSNSWGSMVSNIFTYAMPSTSSPASSNRSPSVASVPLLPHCSHSQSASWHMSFSQQSHIDMNFRSQYLWNPINYGRWILSGYLGGSKTLQNFLEAIRFSWHSRNPPVLATSMSTCRWISADTDPSFPPSASCLGVRIETEYWDPSQEAGKWYEPTTSMTTRKAIPGVLFRHSVIDIQDIESRQHAGMCQRSNH